MQPDLDLHCLLLRNNLLNLKGILDPDQTVQMCGLISMYIGRT